MKNISEKCVKNVRKFSLINFRFAEKSSQLFRLTQTHFFKGGNSEYKNCQKKNKS